MGRVDEGWWARVEGVVLRREKGAIWAAFDGVGDWVGCINVCEGVEGDEAVISRPEGLYDQGDEERRCIPPILQPVANASNVVYPYLAMRRGGVHYTRLHPATNTASYAQTQRLLSSAVV